MHSFNTKTCRVQRAALLIISRHTLTIQAEGPRSIISPIVALINKPLNCHQQVRVELKVTQHTYLHSYSEVQFIFVQFALLFASLCLFGCCRQIRSLFAISCALSLLEGSLQGRFLLLFSLLLLAFLS